jgi:hypothetical protein
MSNDGEIYCYCDLFVDERFAPRQPERLHRSLHRPAQHLHCDRVLSQGQPEGEYHGHTFLMSTLENEGSGIAWSV